MRVKCSVCNEHLDTDTMATVVKVVGWVEWKGNRATGTIKNSSQPMGWAHKVCVETGGAAGSEPSLF